MSRVFRRWNIGSCFVSGSGRYVGIGSCEKAGVKSVRSHVWPKIVRFW